MRVIAGEFRSRVLKSLPGTDVRPTPDRLRESLFNILAPRLEGSVFVDAYAGTGAVGIEALSRGAARAIFLERSREAVAVIRDNLRVLGIAGRAEVILGRAAKLLPKYPADLVFLDPPYRAESEYQDALESLMNASVPLVIAQHDTRMHLKESYGHLRLTRTVKQGDNLLSFYSRDLQD